MATHLLRRVILLIFLMLLLLGDVVDILRGGVQQADSATQAARRTSLGLIAPLPVQ